MIDNSKNPKERMKLNQCDGCRARTIIAWQDSDGWWHCRCASCRRGEQKGLTMGEAIDKWRDARAMDVIDSFYAEGAQ